MDAQSESCEPPPCDPQPPGKIRKAFKLFGKRKPGSSVTSIFSMRGKGDGGPKSPPSRSDTQDGLNEPTAPEAEAEQVDLDQEEESQQEDAPMGEFTSENMRQSISSLTSAKSLSFLNVLRKGRRGVAGERQAQTESQRPGRQRKGLKGLFSNVRWPGKEKEAEEEAEPGPPLVASRSNSVEIIKESLTLTPGPIPRTVEDKQQEEQQQLHTPQEGPTSSKDSLKVSEATIPPTNERLSTLLGDISSILSFDTLTPCGDIVADVEAEWVKASSRMGGDTTLKVDDSDKTSSASIRSKPSPSPTSTLSPTSSKPSPTSAAKPIPSPIISATKPIPSPIISATQPIPSPINTKPITSPLPKPTVSSPTSSPLTKTPQSISSAPIFPTQSSPPARPTPTPAATPIAQPTPTPIPSPIAKDTSTPITHFTPTPTLFSNTQSTQSATSSPTAKPITSPTKPAPSPKSSPELKPTTITSSSFTAASINKPIPISTPAPLSISSPTSESSPPPSKSTTPTSAAVIKTEVAPTPVAKLTQAPTPASKPTTSAAKQQPPPFIIYGKPPSTSAPRPRPKLITTFGLSTSSNTAPITRPDPKPPTGQTTKSINQSDKNAPTVRKPSISDSSTKPLSPVSHTVAAVSSNSFQRTEEEKSMSSRKDLRTDTRDSVATQSITKPVKRGTAVKPTTLSKIPVSGGGRPAKQQHREAQPNGDDDHSNLSTPVNEEQGQFSLSRENSSKETLSDISTESGAITPTPGQEDIFDPNLGLQSSACGAAGATSLSRESKIPVKHGTTPTYHSMQGRTEVARSRIPVSKVPVRRTSNKPAPTATAANPRK
nr:APC membrane recruitment protein 2 [Misgurnus anguillicaudatus]